MLDGRPVEGYWRRLRWGVNAGLIAILFAIPWIQLAGEPLIRMDIPRRQFHVFGLVIFPQELYFLWLIVASLVLFLFFFTALAGRVWCGWACPQTVFTDVYASVARFVQNWKGSTRPHHVARWRLVATHLVWLAMSSLVAFHLVGYFVSPYEMVANLRGEGPSHETGAGFLLAITLFAYFDLGILRQTFCRFLCPYARLQSVLFDRDTLVVGYDTRRGEPRGKPGEDTGDCVDCGLCVAVCPTLIDIRDGMQMECITCTQCIDACNGVMEHLDREPNLIGYRSLVSLEGERATRILRPRVAVYGALLLAVGTAFGVLLQGRLPMDFQVARDAGALTTVLADGRVGNAFTLMIENRDRADRSYELRLAESDDFELVAGLNPIAVPAVSSTQTKVFVLPRSGTAASSREIRFVLQADDGSGAALERTAVYYDPGGRHGES